MAATTGTKRAELRCIAYNADKAGVRLRDALYQTLLLLRGSTPINGTVLISASGNGSSVSHQIDPGLSSSDARDLYESLITDFDEYKAELVDGGNETPSDAEVLDEMLHNLAPRRSAYADRSGMCLA